MYGPYIHFLATYGKEKNQEPKHTHTFKDLQKVYNSIPKNKILAALKEIGVNRKLRHALNVEQTLTQWDRKC